MSKEMQAAFTLLEEEKGISPEVVIGAIAEALTAAYKKAIQSITKRDN